MRKLHTPRISLFIGLLLVSLMSGCQKDSSTPDEPDIEPSAIVATAPDTSETSAETTPANTKPEPASTESKTVKFPGEEIAVTEPDETRQVLDADGLPVSWVNPAPDAIKKHDFQPSPLAPLVSMGEDGTLDYQPYSSKGDQIPDFSTVGYQHSEVPIPSVPVVEKLSAPTATASKVGNMKYPVGMDSHQQIQNALDRVAARRPDASGFRGTVLLEKGTWYVGRNLHVRSGVVLRGEGDGEDGTVLIFTIPDGNGTGIQIGDSRSAGTTSTSSTFTAAESAIADAYIPTGSFRVTIEDAKGFEKGDSIVVKKTTNQAWIDKLGMGERLRHIRGGREGAGKRPWGTQQYGHNRAITAIEGNTLVLDSPMIQSIAAVHGGGVVTKVEKPVDTLIGVESLRVVSNYDTTVKDENKGSNFKNLRNGVVVSAVNSWVRDVTVKHVWFGAVIASNAQNSTIRDCASLEPVGPKRGGRRYTYNISSSSGMLVYKCTAEDGRHDFVVGARTPGPNAFVDCTAVRGGQSEPHHRWGAGILYDNVTMEAGGSLAAINRGDSGSGHGWAGANTVFWNCDAEKIIVADPETIGENNFAIGFTGTVKDEYDTGSLRYANTRAGYWGTPKEGKYYGFAIMGDGYIESPDAPVEPASLFKQQLIDRIGASRALRALE
mgnify:CR=1 FL=1